MELGRTPASMRGEERSSLLAATPEPSTPSLNDARPLLSPPPPPPVGYPYYPQANVGYPPYAQPAGNGYIPPTLAKNLAWACGGCMCLFLLQFIATLMALMAVVSSIGNAMDFSIVTPGWEKSTTLTLNWNGDTVTAGDPSILSKLFDPEKVSLTNFVSALKFAASESSIDGVVVLMRGPDISLAQAQQIRTAIKKFGKPVHFYAEEISSLSAFYVMSAGTSVLHPGGSVSISGFLMESLFFRETFDWAGIKVRAFKAGEYKGAIESLNQTSYSTAVRSNMQDMLNSFMNQVVSDIASDKNLAEDVVRNLIQQGVYYNATEAKALGLINSTSYRQDLVDNLGLKHLYPLTLFADGVDRPLNRLRAAVVHVSGEISSGQNQQPILGSTVAGSDSVCGQVRDALSDKDIAGLILHIDSPGGSALASDEIYSCIKKAKSKHSKTVVAVMSSMAASGGYYIAMAADKVIAHPGTITGSIGVFGLKLIFTDAFWNKFGNITTDRIYSNENATFMSSMVDLSDQQAAAEQKAIGDVYDRFLQVVSDKVNISSSTLREDLAGGRVYDGATAKTKGLVDSLGTFEDAVKFLFPGQAESTVSIVTYPKWSSEAMKMISNIFLQPNYHADEGKEDPFRTSTRLRGVTTSLQIAFAQVEPIMDSIVRLAKAVGEVYDMFTGRMSVRV